MNVYLDLEAVSRRMRGRRVELGYSVEELARRSKVTSTTIRNYEATRNDMGICRLFAIATALHVSLDWLCGRVDAVFPVVALGRKPAKKTETPADTTSTI